MSKSLQTPIEYLKSVGPERAKLLKSEHGIYSFQDLLYHFPFRYVDKSKFYTISSISSESVDIQLCGKITQLNEYKQKNGKRLVATFVDSSGSLDLTWFRYNKWLVDNLPLNIPITVFGKISFFQNKPYMPHPEIETLEKVKNSSPIGLSPIYPSTEKMQKHQFTQKTYKNLLLSLFKEIGNEIEENLPLSICEKYDLMDRKTAFYQIHFPDNTTQLAQAEKRIKFEELFFLQLNLLIKKNERKSKVRSNPFSSVGSYFHHYYQDILPFSLTDAQKKVFKEIRVDLSKPYQMNRLLQGDVGSGKTIIAILSILLAIDNGYQACIMAPTEVLAKQHYQNIQADFKKLNLEIALLTGSTKPKEKKEILNKLAKGEITTLIGTHSLIEDTVKFKQLGLAIIDEQHKFGVAQRAKLYQKNTFPPHILAMTATPIPRTLAMSLYGDLDLSTIDELPAGRKTIKTIHKLDSHRLEVFSFIKNQIKEGRQIYVVYPLIEESKALDYKDLMDGYESLSRAFPLPTYAISIVHGKMKPEDKEIELRRFLNKETQILISTTVIEVGINVPNASVMIIESSERFGLSQLHQLRGRVGRGEYQSYCVLMSREQLSNEARQRLNTMVSTNDGFEIAEVDLQLRGPGDILGTQQSGVLNLKLAKINKDRQLLFLARNVVEELLTKDSNLSDIENIPLKNFYIKNHLGNIKWGNIS